MNTCPFGGSCWMSCLAFCLIWLVTSSVLLYYTWNKVVCTVTSLKKVKYWQPTLAIITVAVLTLPCSMQKCGDSGHCDHDGKGEMNHKAADAKAKRK